MESTNKSILYFQITDVWKRHCELHSELFDLTCDEYSLLLKSDLDNLEKKIEEKNYILSVIRDNEIIRDEVVAKIKTSSNEKEITNIKDVISFFSDFEPEMKDKHLYRFNELLVDIIGKIQDQNKKNQIFINKAINSLRAIREDATGKQTVNTYNAQGKTQSRLLEKSP
ncbi:MAG: flagellar export chaperone FlgN [Bdellovibrionota bacterium]|nr:flagellar export chaperone FlgN [Bdellovibrionota bacterium]